MRPKAVYFKLDGVSVKRYGFQVAPAEASTIHAAQGGQWNAVVVDLVRPSRMPPPEFWLCAYVAISRATDLSGLLVLRLPEKHELEVGAPDHLLQEVDRLLCVEKKSTASLLQHLLSLSCEVPPAVLALPRASSSCSPSAGCCH